MTLHPGDARSDLVPATPAATPGAHATALLRIALGLVFLWAFLDKTFGLGYATPPARAWISGGSPTKGFLGAVEVGPLRDAFHAIAGAAWADWLFMLGLLGIGVAVTAGVALRVSAVAGTIMLALMWLAEWPLAMLTATGEPSGSTNPVIDSHVIYALGLIAVAAAGAGRTWGLGKAWDGIAFVHAHPWTR
jgi:thiosulfate dehydrogenase (quinone) large subunit